MTVEGIQTKTTLAALVCAVFAIGPAAAFQQAGPGKYDGQWHLTFTTSSPACDQAYDFDVNISNGVITHPNLVRFKGQVTRSGAVRASVIVQDKSAAGSGRLASGNGGGVWSGRSGAARCSGRWTASKI